MGTTEPFISVAAHASHTKAPIARKRTNSPQLELAKASKGFQVQGRKLGCMIPRGTISVTAPKIERPIQQDHQSSEFHHMYHGWDGGEYDSGAAKGVARPEAERAALLFLLESESWSSGFKFSNSAVSMVSICLLLERRIYEGALAILRTWRKIIFQRKRE